MNRTHLGKAVRKVYLKTPQYQLDKLLSERSKWKRKLTIASNKLRRVEKQLDTLAQENVNRLMGKATSNESTNDSGS